MLQFSEEQQRLSARTVSLLALWFTTIFRLAAPSTNGFNEDKITQLCGTAMAIQDTAAVAIGRLQKLHRQEQAAAEARNKLLLAALVVPTVNDTILFTAAARAAKSGSQKLAAAMLCICASDGTTRANKACETAGTDQVTFSATGTNAATAYNKIAAECGKPDEAVTHTSPDSLLEAAIRGFEDDLSKGKGTGNKVGILGTIDGTGGGACSGKHSSDNGICMFAGATDGKPTTPAWLTQLKVAAAEARQAETQLAQIMADEAELASSNSTLSALMETALNQAEEPSGKPNTQKESPVVTAPKQDDCKGKKGAE
uniref:Variant surface glycoprotein n=1 Tax=Trypanosoma brucei TaxID=5691 RepID=A0A1V0FYE4_9TRYP|nr:variant surface glycoprotein [Trypanosoma brucei]